MSSYGASLQGTLLSTDIYNFQLLMLHVQVCKKKRTKRQSLQVAWQASLCSCSGETPLHTPNFTHGAPCEGWWRPSKVWGQRYFVPRCLVCLASALSGQRTSLLRLSRHQLETSHVAFCCVVLVSCVNWVALCKATLHLYCDFLLMIATVAVGEAVAEVRIATSHEW